MCNTDTSGGSRNFGRGFPLLVDPRCRGLKVEPPAAEEASIFKSIQSNKNLTFYCKLWLAIPCHAVAGC